MTIDEMRDRAYGDKCNRCSKRVWQMSDRHPLCELKQKPWACDGPFTYECCEETGEVFEIKRRD